MCSLYIGIVSMCARTFVDDGIIETEKERERKRGARVRVNLFRALNIRRANKVQRIAFTLKKTKITIVYSIISLLLS